MDVINMVSVITFITDGVFLEAALLGIRLAAFLLGMFHSFRDVMSRACPFGAFGFTTCQQLA